MSKDYNWVISRAVWSDCLCNNIPMLIVGFSAAFHCVVSPCSSQQVKSLQARWHSSSHREVLPLNWMDTARIGDSQRFGTPRWLLKNSIHRTRLFMHESARGFPRAADSTVGWRLSRRCPGTSCTSGNLQCWLSPVPILPAAMGWRIMS